MSITFFKSNSLESHFGSTLDSTLLVHTTLHIPICTLLVKELTCLTHGHSHKLRLAVPSTLASLTTLPSASTAEHLQGLHRCACTKTVRVMLLASTALTVELLMGLHHLLLIDILIL